MHKAGIGWTPHRCQQPSTRDPAADRLPAIVDAWPTVAEAVARVSLSVPYTDAVRPVNDTVADNRLLRARYRRRGRRRFGPLPVRCHGEVLLRLLLSLAGPVVTRLAADSRVVSLCGEPPRVWWRATSQGMTSNRPSQTTSDAHAAFWMLHGRVPSGKHEHLMPIVAADEVRRRPVAPPNLDDLGRLVGRANNPAVHVQPVTHYCAHGNSSQRVHSNSLYLPAHHRKRDECAQAQSPNRPTSPLAASLARVQSGHPSLRAPR